MDDLRFPSEPPRPLSASAPPLPPAPFPEPPRPTRRRPRRRWRAALGPFLGVLIGAGVTFGALTWSGALDTDEPPPPSPQLPPPTAIAQNPITITPGDAGLERVSAVAAKAIPSIVTVEVSGTDISGIDVQGSGSGVVFRSDGYIVTNNHVVEDADEINVVFSDGRSYQATVVGTDPLTDLALIHVEATGLVPIDLGDVDGLEIGDLAIAVGNPLGLGGGPSVTSGIVSAFERTLRVGAPTGQLFGLIQTDAPITRGSSGGALLDENGKLIGITTAIGVSDVGAEGLGFAVPVNMVMLVAEDLLVAGEVQHAFLGIRGETAFDDADDGAVVPIGAQIVEILADSAVGQAGARQGDIIVALDGKKIITMDQLVANMRNRRAGETVQVLIQRDAELVTIELTLDRFRDE